MSGLRDNVGLGAMDSIVFMAVDIMIGVLILVGLFSIAYDALRVMFPWLTRHFDQFANNIGW